ncbi:MAG: hypothetical protein DRP94_02065 [Candidatus Latescibacterota bacterium]|nr:MAG: hypothetical protein DRP94_02065 [Candidatus Latescibacterota bacterium]
MTRQLEIEKAVEKVLNRYIESGKLFELLEDYLLGRAMQEVQGEENVPQAEALKMLENESCL